MKNIELHEAGIFEIHYVGPELDLLSVSRFQFGLHQLFEKVALKTLLDDEKTRHYLLSEFEPAFLRALGSRRIGYRDLPNIIGSSSAFRPLTEVEEFMTLEPIIFMNIKNVRIGSWIQDLAVVTVPLLANPDVRAVLAGLFSNFTYALMKSGIENVIKPDDSHLYESDDAVHDPFDVGENISEIIRTLLESGRSDARSLTIRHKSGKKESEIEIKLRR